MHKSKDIFALFLISSLLIYSFAPNLVIAQEIPPQEELPAEVVSEPTPEVTADPVVEEPAPESTIVETGDAVALADVENEVNINVVSTAEDPIAEEPAPEEESATPPETLISEDPDPEVEEEGGLVEQEIATEELAQEDSPEEGVQEADAVVTSTNDAILENSVEVEADTGENEANNNSDAVIDTGDAIAEANVINVVNTNIFNSEGLFLFLSNLIAGFGETLDFRDFGFFSSDSYELPENTRGSSQGNNAGECGGGCGAIDNLEIKNTNNAKITNDLVVRSNTGDNSSTGNSGGGLVQTGNSYAAANVMNIANTNIINSNYLLMSFNSFGNYGGDVVFPAAELFSQIFGGNGNSTNLANNVSVENTNNANVENSIGVESNTGNNDASGDSSADGGTIVTGNANSAANVINQVNTNIFGASTFQILFRIHGNWSGNIFGAPEGLTWKETSSGVELSFESGYGGSGCCSGVDSLSLQNTNDATVTNNINVVALTGDNKASGGSGGEIYTGDAYAAANVVNVVNTNVVSQNWLLAIINIFGDWSGDISFGRPDLWVGARVEMSESVAEPYDSVLYKVTVANNGDVDAHGVKLKTSFLHDRLIFVSDENRTNKTGDMGEVMWDLGSIPAGGYKEFTYRAQVTSDIPLGKSFIENNFEVWSNQEDNNYFDNKDVLSFDTWRENIAYLTGTFVEYSLSPRLEITKRHSGGIRPVQASTTITYEIVVENSGPGPAYQALLVDTLEDEYGNIVYEEFWDLGKIYSGEQINITYNTFFNEYTETGKYTNYARVYAYGRHDSFLYGNNASSDVAESIIYIEALPAPEPIPELPIESVAEDSVEVIEETFEVEVVPDVVEIYAKEDIEDLLALYDHPIFNQHPVYSRVTGPYVGHPIFAQHPVYMNYTTFFVDGFTPWYEDVAGIGFVKFLMLPWGDLTQNDDANKQANGGGDRNMLALLALSMFVLRKPVSKK